MYSVKKTAILVLLGVALVAAFPGLALASEPSTTPTLIRVDDFESGSLGDWVASPLTGATAYWGVMGNVAASGTKSVWCSGTYPSGWPNYRSGSQGDLKLNLPELSDYYSSQASFKYTLPSRGDADYYGFSVHYPPLDAPETYAGGVVPSLTSSGQWLDVSYDLSNPALNGYLSRRGGLFYFRWSDSAEGPLQYVRVGQGPSIDVVKFTGYRYGPVRSLTATQSGEDVALSWTPPATSRSSSAEDTRPIGYRVWRANAASASPSWSELTTTRTASSGFTDVSSLAGGNYLYAVQAWDPVSGDGHGQLASPVQIAVTSAGLDLVAPYTTSDIDGAWHDAPVTVHLSATDPDSPPGSVSTFYRLGSGETSTYTGPIQISNEGATALQFWSVDPNGNRETTRSATVHIDTVAPESTATVPAVARGAAKSVAIVATDAGSGVSTTYWRVGGGSVAQGTTMTLPSVSGTYSVEYASVDAAGNRETTKTATVRVVVPSVARLGGDTRYDVAAMVARAGWDRAGDKTWPGVAHVVVACGEDRAMADPLCAAGLAGSYDAPVLTVKTTGVPTAVKTVIAEIAAANPGVQVHIVGGTASVPPAVWSSIKAIPGVSSTYDRIDGADRYAVSLGIARRIQTRSGGPAGLGGVLLVAADNPAAFYDALAVSPYAYAERMPMLAVRKVSMSSGAASFVSGVKGAGRPIYAASSATYISSGVLTTTGATRLTTSTSQYAAARVLATQAEAKGWGEATHTGLAAKLSDTLTGGALIGRKRGVMLFTDSGASLRADATAYITGRATAIEQGWVFGGPASVTTSAESAFLGLLE